MRSFIFVLLISLTWISCNPTQKPADVIPKSADVTQKPAVVTQKPAVVTQKPAVVSLIHVPEFLRNLVAKLETEKKFGHFEPLLTLMKKIIDDVLHEMGSHATLEQLINKLRSLKIKNPSQKMLDIAGLILDELDLVDLFVDNLGSSDMKTSLLTPLLERVKSMDYGKLVSHAFDILTETVNNTLGQTMGDKINALVKTGNTDDALKLFKDGFNVLLKDSGIDTGIEALKENLDHIRKSNQDIWSKLILMALKHVDIGRMRKDLIDAWHSGKTISAASDVIKDTLSRVDVGALGQDIIDYYANTTESILGRLTKDIYHDILFSLIPHMKEHQQKMDNIHDADYDEMMKILGNLGHMHIKMDNLKDHIQKLTFDMLNHSDIFDILHRIYTIATHKTIDATEYRVLLEDLNLGYLAEDLIDTLTEEKHNPIGAAIREFIQSKLPEHKKTKEESDKIRNVLFNLGHLKIKMRNLNSKFQKILNDIQSQTDLIGLALSGMHLAGDPKHWQAGVKEVLKHIHLGTIAHDILDILTEEKNNPLGLALKRYIDSQIPSDGTAGGGGGAGISNILGLLHPSSHTYKNIHTDSNKNTHNKPDANKNTHTDANKNTHNKPDANTHGVANPDVIVKTGGEKKPGDNSGKKKPGDNSAAYTSYTSPCMIMLPIGVAMLLFAL